MTTSRKAAAGLLFVAIAVIVTPHHVHASTDLPFVTNLVDYNSVSDGSMNQVTFRIPHKVMEPVSSVRFVYANYSSGGTVGNVLPIRASLESTDGTIYPLTFNGSRDVTIPIGGIVVSDPVTVSLTVGDYIYSRTYVNLPSGQKYPEGYGCVGEAGCGFISGDDYTVSGIVPSNGGYLYSPIAIIGTPSSKPWPWVVLLGDSIMAQTNSSDGISGLYFGSQAMVQDGIPFINLAQQGETAQGFASGNAADVVRMAMSTGDDGLFGPASYAINEYGINDLRGGETASSTLGYLDTISESLLSGGVGKVYKTTIGPNVDSTDGWTTLVNQTPRSTEPDRVALNGAIRDTSSPFTPLEIADIMESSRNSGLYRVADPNTGVPTVYTGDGLHPNDAMATLMADAIPASLFPYLNVSTSTIQVGTTTTIGLTGINTSWSAGNPGSPLFVLSGGAGAGIISQAVIDGTHATLSVNSGSATSTLTITDPANGDTVTLDVVDMVPPVISSISASPNMFSATIEWSTDKAATSRLTFGPTQSYSSGSVSTGALATYHSESIDGLDACSSYHYEVSSTDDAANTATSTDQTFTTTGCSEASSTGSPGVGVISGWGSYGIPPPVNNTGMNGVSTSTCLPGALFNTVTGVRCSSSASSAPAAPPSQSDGSPAAPGSSGSTWTFDANLQLKVMSVEVKLLQEYLNSHGYTVAVTGAGSSGNETDYFGALTKAALIKFQKANGITPAVGYFGPITRGFMAAHR
jgi:lysophospholipase L1-like esterase